MRGKLLIILLGICMFFSCNLMLNKQGSENGSSSNVTDNSSADDTLTPPSNNSDNDFVSSFADRVMLVTQDKYIDNAAELKDGLLSVNIPESGKDLYLVISNTTGEELASPSISGYDVPVSNTSYSSKNISVSHIANTSSFTDAVIYEEYTPQQVHRAVSKSVPQSPSYSSYALLKEGETKDFYEYFRQKKYTATLRKKVCVNTAYGTKTLYVFVEDAMWGLNGAKINQAFVDSQTEAFLKDGEYNDIYDYISSVFGKEWGEHNDSSLIGNNNEIVILFSQVGNSTNTNSGVVGYYYNLHNFKSSKYSTSSEAVCLNMNAYITFANPELSLTTMAHEFQHAIHFYNREVKNTGKSATWINEMFSALAEDSIADYLKVKGPGNNNILTGSSGSGHDLVNGRIAEYIRGSRYDFTRWNDSSAFGTDAYSQVYPYGLVYSLGTYLVRNFGTDFIKAYMESSETVLSSQKDDTSSLDNKSREVLVNAINKANNLDISWSDIMRGWGCSVLLSDDNAPCGVSNTINSGNGDYWFLKPYQKYDLRIPSVMYDNYIVPSYYPATMWDNGAYLSTTGPFVFNQKADRVYSNAENLVLKGNTNTFVLLTHLAEKGIKQYKIDEVEGLTYSLVLK